MRNAHHLLDKLLVKEAEKPYTNSVLLGVQSGDRRIDFRGAAGHASVDNPYFLASVTKTFTATVLFQLVDEGRLDLSDRIQTYLHHLPLEGIHVLRGRDYSPELKVYQLVHQTSGLADYFADGLVKDFEQNRDHAYSVTDVLEIVRGKSPFAAPDSGRSHYSDTNYQLLGALIEVVTERSLAEVFRDRIFDRLEMADTYLFDIDLPRQVEPTPFYFRDTPLSLPSAMTSERGAGGAVSSVDDTLRFLRAYFGGELFDARHFGRIKEWNRMFFPMEYGYGLWRFNLPRWITLFRKTPELIGHAGVNGAMAFYNPEHDLYVVGTLNQLDKPARQFSFMPKVVGAVT
jgi:CubicO group peptidase (beta-lactamase class C family)